MAQTINSENPSPWRLTSFGVAAALVVLAALWSATSQAQIRYYRYVNDQGVRVISHNIPPEYAQKGYEVITHTGKVLEVVPPAPNPEELQQVEAQRAKERALLAEFEVLARRYSNEREIYAARDRRLAHLDANVAILRSNIGNINGQIDSLMRQAAEVERTGREVPAALLKSLAETRAELGTSEEALRAREAERDSIHQEFDRQVQLFREGHALLETRRSD